MWTTAGSVALPVRSFLDPRSFSVVGSVGGEPTPGGIARLAGLKSHSGFVYLSTFLLMHMTPKELTYFLSRNLNLFNERISIN